MGVRHQCQCVGFLLLVACHQSPARPLDGSGTVSLQQGVRALVDQIPEDLAHDGPRGWLRHFLRSPAFYMASNGRVVFPSNAVADSAIGAMALTTRSMELHWLDPRIDSLAPDLAAVASAFTERITDSAGRVQAFEGFLTAIAVPVDSGWQLQSLHWSLTPAGPSP